MELAYTRTGEYLIPDVALTGQPDRPLGRYGLIRKEYLRQNKPVLWARLCTSGELFPHCREIEDKKRKFQCQQAGSNIRPRFNLQ